MEFIKLSKFFYSKDVFKIVRPHLATRTINELNRDACSRLSGTTFQQCHVIYIPGADITDYFNYGFTEDSWNQYCKKQRNMREMNTGKPVFVSIAR